jgi:hypothetical protein
MPRSAKQKSETKEKETRVVQARRAGATWLAIAEEVGYKDASGAYQAYRRATASQTQMEPKELQALELDRLDRLHLAAWNKACSGDLAAMHVVLRIIEQRVKILRLESAERTENALDIWDQLAAEILK